MTIRTLNETENHFPRIPLYIYCGESRGSSVRNSELRVGRTGFDFRQRQEFFFFANRPPVKCVPGLKWKRMKLTIDL